MNKDFIEKQKKDAQQKLENVEGPEKQKMTIVFQYLSSLLEPEKYIEADREDLRKLALELGFKENTVFDDWVKTASK
jgi:hypothetical protein